MACFRPSGMCDRDWSAVAISKVVLPPVKIVGRPIGANHGDLAGERLREVEPEPLAPGSREVHIGCVVEGDHPFGREADPGVVEAGDLHPALELGRHPQEFVTDSAGPHRIENFPDGSTARS